MKHFPIIYCVDKNILAYLELSLNSIAKHLSDNYKIYICYNDKTTDRNILENLCSSIKFKNIAIKNISSYVPDKLNFKCSSRLTPTAYYRLILPYAFPEYDYCLYLDADTVICKSIDPLIKFSDQIKYIGGVYSLVKNDSWAANQLHYIKTSTYINSGVLLMNLKALREDHFIDKVFNINPSFYHSAWMEDQTIINEIYKNRITLLDPKYNYFIKTHLPYFMNSEIKDLLNKDAIIYHFVGNKFLGDKLLNMSKFNRVRDIVQEIE